MKDTNSSRRVLLKQMASMTVLGAVSTLRAAPLLARETGDETSRLVAGIKGKVISRDDKNYEIWRQSMVWHRSKPGRYPDLIVHVESEQDVIAAVKYAAEHKHKIAIRSGGHNSTGTSLRDGGMLIDVSALGDVQIDAAKQIARIQPGVRSLQLVTDARAKGLSFPVPHCPSVGLSGFVMGGGIGWNYGLRGGMSCFSIEAAEIVTADGKLVMANADENPDLFWAVRGAGPGFFGVVTRLHLKLYPVPKVIWASSYILPLDELTTVTNALDGLMKIKDKRVEVISLLAHNPNAPAGTPPEKAKICFITAFAFADSVAEAKSILAPFSESALGKQSIVKTENQDFSFEGLYAEFFSQEVPAGRMARYAVDNVMTDEPSAVLHALADHFRAAPSPYAHVLAAYGMDLKASDDACYSSIANSYLGCYAIWDEETNDDLNYEWLSKTVPLMDPFAKGHYVNEVEPRFNPDRIQQCFSDANWKRLQQLRDKYDPNGVFHKYLGQA